MQQRLTNVFCECLGISPDIVTENLAYGSIRQWDSVAHMTLIVGLEDEFDIMIETDDVIDMSTFKKAEEIVCKYL